MDNISNPELIANNTIPPQQNNGKSKLFLFITLVVIFIAAVTGAYILGTKNQSLPPSPTPKTITKIATPTLSLSDTANWKTYKSTEYGFQINYPNGFSFLGKDSPLVNPNPFTSRVQEILGFILFSQDNYKNTNLNQAYIGIGANKQAGDSADCMFSFPLGDKSYSDEGNITVGKNEFTFRNFPGAAAGTASDTRIYHTFHPTLGSCIEINMNLFTSEIANYPEGSNITKVDEKKIWEQFDQILSTFRFD